MSSFTHKTQADRAGLTANLNTGGLPRFFSHYKDGNHTYAVLVISDLLNEYFEVCLWCLWFIVDLLCLIGRGAFRRRQTARVDHQGAGT